MFDWMGAIIWFCISKPVDLLILTDHISFRLKLFVRGNGFIIFKEKITEFN